jgi:cytochrome c6
MFRIYRVALAILVGFAFSLPLLAEDGAALYKAKCVGCHAADGTGSAMGKKLGAKALNSPEVQKLSDADIEKAISAGKGKMPGFKTLTPEQVKALVGEVRAFGKK